MQTFRHCAKNMHHPTVDQFDGNIFFVLLTVKDGLIRYSNTKTSHNGVNSMWIVKNSTSLCHPWSNWMSVQQHQFRCMTFPPCIHQSHTICLSLELLHLYATHSRGEMEVTDIPTSKLRVKGVFHRHHQSWWR